MPWRSPAAVQAAIATEAGIAEAATVIVATAVAAAAEA
jgi:hypothetical protein